MARGYAWSKEGGTMDTFRLRYIELKRQFEEQDGASDVVRALYLFKEELEADHSEGALIVLYDVLEILRRKKMPMSSY